MDITEIDLRLIDDELAKIIAESVPEPGFTVIQSPPQINASHGANIIFRIIVKFANPISIQTDIQIPASVALSAFSIWCAKVIAKKKPNRQKDKTTINGKTVTLDTKGIMVAITEDINGQAIREKQWKERDKQTSGSRSKEK
jgi:hypothetical protein